MTHHQKVSSSGFIPLIGLVVILAVAIIAAGAIYFVSGSDKTNTNVTAIKTNTNSSTQNANTTLGGDRDAHGCIGSAGYVWCEVKNKCLRSWEEECDATNSNNNVNSNSNGNTNINTNINTNTANQDIIGANGYTFETEAYGLPNADSRIIATDKNGLKTTLIESTRTTAGLENNHGLYKMSPDYPKSGNEIYLVDALMYSDAGGSGVWRYSFTDGTLKKLENISRANDTGQLFFDTDMKKAVFAPWGGDTGQSQNLMLFDFATDTVRELVSLSGRETFNAGWVGYDATYDITWVDGAMIRYSVYNQSTGNSANSTPKTKITTREITIE